MDTIAAHVSADQRGDEHAWLVRQAAALIEGRVADVDAGVLGEYLIDMAARDRHEVRSRLIVLLIHLIKCHSQPERVGPSWADTIAEQQDSLRAIFDDSPSLLAHASGILPSAWVAAGRRAAIQMGGRAVSMPAGLNDVAAILGFEPAQVPHPSAPRTGGGPA